MADKAPIVFKSEPTLWAMLAQVSSEGQAFKPFDMRWWDISGDDRIYRLSVGATRPMLRERGWVPAEKEVSFVNKATGELLTFEYQGVEFTAWAPGFGFILLGKLLSPPVEG